MEIFQFGAEAAYVLIIDVDVNFRMIVRKTRES